jgi:hypothetical protein
VNASAQLSYARTATACFVLLCAHQLTYLSVSTYLFQERQDAIHELVENVEKDGIDFTHLGYRRV